MMDQNDERDLYQEWRKFDQRLTALYEKEAWKFLPKLEKLIKEKLGWRKKFPEDDYERFQSFMTFIESVYLRPSLGITDDRPWSDLDSGTGSDETDSEPDDTDGTQSWV